MVTLNSNNDIKKEYLLDDGSRIWLNRNSQIQHPKKFKKDSRTIVLKGEAYFEVASIKNKPFVVDVENTKVTVLGTKFNIDAIGSKAIVSVSEGKVAFASSSNNSIGLIRTENQEGVFDEKDGEMHKKILMLIFNPGRHMNIPLKVSLFIRFWMYLQLITCLHTK